MKKSISLLIVTIMVISIFMYGCNNSNNVPPTSSGETPSENTQVESTYKHKFTMTTPLGDTHSAVSTWKTAFEELSERTNGRLTGEIYPSSQLAAGNMATSLDMHVKGTIDMFCGGNSIYGAYVKDAEVFGIPFLFGDFEAADRTLHDEDVIAYFNGELEKNNIHFLGWMENAWMVFTNNVRELKVPSDLSGLKMRCADGDLVDAAIQNAGGSVVYLSLNDLYTSLQQGVVDGQDNGIAGAVFTNKLYEVQKYLTHIYITYSPFVISINNELWNKIPDSDKAILEEIVEKYSKQQVEMNRSQIEPNLEYIIEQGMQVYTPTEREVEEWIAVMGHEAEPVAKVLQQYNQDFVKLVLSKAKGE